MTKPTNISYVLMVTPGGLEHGGGIGRMTQYMLEAWSEKEDRPTIEIVDSRGPGHVFFSPWYLFRCAITLLMRAPSRPLLHVHVAGRGSTIRKIIVVHVGRLLGFPIVLHLHDYNFRKSYEEFPHAIRWAAQSMFKRSQRVIALSRLDRELLISVLGVEPNRVEVLANAVPAPKNRGKGRKLKQKHIIFLGDLSLRKGVHDLVDALASESLRNLDWRATLAGGGAELDRFRTQADVAGIADRVAIPGWLSRQGVTSLMDSADILVLPSYDEGMAMSVLEGLSRGLCVVSTPVGGLADVVEDRVSGLVVAPGDVAGLAKALEECISDEELAAHLQTGALDLFDRRFDVSRYPDRLHEIYKAAAMELLGDS